MEMGKNKKLALSLLMGILLITSLEVKLFSHQLCSPPTKNKKDYFCYKHIYSFGPNFVEISCENYVCS
jgi:hypothetical protein